jgi:hypothetical protein
VTLQNETRRISLRKKQITKFLIGGNMTKRIIFSLVTILSLSSFAQQNLGELEVGSNAQDKQAYVSATDAAVIAHVNAEIADKCDSHGCTFVSRVDHKKGWTLTFNIGNGSAGNNGSGTTINLNGNNQSSSNQNYYGMSLSYTNMTCTSDFKIDMDDFINNKARAIAEREDGTYSMKPLTSDMKFVQLLKLEIYKQLGQAGCLR